MSVWKARRRAARPLLWLAVVMMLCACTVAQTPAFVSFDAPDAGDRGTVPCCINNRGVVAGVYFDNVGLAHGFIRDSTGVISEFTPPAAPDIVVRGINNKGQVLGFGGSHSFLRTPNGGYFHISVPLSFATTALGINDNGQVTGYYNTETGPHGFIRNVDGSFVTVDDPEMTDGKGTFPYAINNDGEIAGYYYDRVTRQARAFVRDQFGNFTNFDAAPGDWVVVNPMAINLDGAVTGIFGDALGFSQGFVRDAAGNLVDFGVPDATATSPQDINDSGVVVGQWADAQSVHGFMRNVSGTIISFSVPTALHGTFPTSINNTGRITGYYRDSASATHGFVR